MRTDQLILQLAAEGPSPAGAPAETRKRLVWSAALGLLIAAPAAAAWFGLRGDLAARLTDPGVALKFGLAAAFALGGLWLARRIGEPGRAAPAMAALAPVAALIALALALWPGDLAAWAPTFDKASLSCMGSVATLSLAAMAPMLLALRRAAPTRPALAGAAAGLAAGGVGCAAYAIHCPIDVPGYVAVWYPAGAALAALIGAALGRRLLAW